MTPKLRAAVIGATGIAGQQFLPVLDRHPMFELVRVAASERSSGKRYADALRAPSGQIAWYPEGSIPETFAELVVEDGSKLDPEGLDVVFSAVESDAARALEARFGQHVPVVSTASAFRYDEDTPILIPAVNGDHAPLVRVQQKNRGWNGFVVPIPNCTTTGLAIALAPLARAFGVRAVVMTSMQATSGAGRSPGVIALDIVDNVIPFIPKEEEKVERETQKILGRLATRTIESDDLVVSAHCNRVAVLDGHLETVSVGLESPASIDDVKSVMRAFGRDINPATHPSAPEHWITVTDDPYRPQPRLDRMRERGMTTTVGRVREDRVLGPNGFRFCLLSHNTRMGAAMGAVLVAEDLARRGFLRAQGGTT